MTTLRELTVEEVTGILSRGTFAELISTVEHVQFECKNGLYDTKTVKSKIELAKDVSALANSSGGYLLIGPATRKNPLHQGDEVIFRTLWLRVYANRDHQRRGNGMQHWNEENLRMLHLDWQKHAQNEIGTKDDYEAFRRTLECLGTNFSNSVGPPLFTKFLSQ
jgi:hypothetical protein